MARHEIVYLKEFSLETKNLYRRIVKEKNLESWILNILFHYLTLWPSASYFNLVVLAFIVIQPSMTWSEWNIDENFGLKFHLSYAHTYTKNLFFLNPSMCPFSDLLIYFIKGRIFTKNYKFSDLLCSWRDFKKMINETLSQKFHPYSILTRSLMVEWLKFNLPAYRNNQARYMNTIFYPVWIFPPCHSKENGQKRPLFLR